MSGENARLIVVDDEPQIRGMIVDYLGRRRLRCARMRQRG